MIEDFPTFAEWISFEAMWDINLPVLQISNAAYPSQNDILKAKVLEVSQETKVDARLILAVIMQEVG